MGKPGKTIGNYEVFEEAPLGKDLVSRWFKACSTRSGRELVCRKVDKGALVKTLRTDMLSRELELMKKLNCEHVLRVYDCVQSKHAIYLMQEYAVLTLEARKTTHPDMTGDEIKQVMAQLLLAVAHSHSRQIAHRNISPTSVLLDPLGKVKLSDFSCATPASPPAAVVPFPRDKWTTITFLAPEVLSPDNRLANLPERADMWGFGATLYYLESGLSPFEVSSSMTGDTNTLEQRIVRGRFIMQRGMSKDCKDLVAKLVVSDASRRLFLDSVVSHKYFADALNPELVAAARKKDRDGSKPLSPDTRYLPTGAPSEVTVFELAPAGDAKGGSMELQAVRVSEARGGQVVDIHRLAEEEEAMGRQAELEAVAAGRVVGHRGSIPEVAANTERRGGRAATRAQRKQPPQDELN